MAVVSPGSTAVDVAAAGTIGASSITDANRQAATAWGTGQQGGSTDGLTPPAGIAVWELRTNLFRRGQCDSLGGGGTDWNPVSAGVTASIDATTPAPFSPQSVKFVADGTGANQGAAPKSGSGLGAAVGTSAVASVWFKGVAGQSYTATSRWVNTDASTNDSAVTTFTATGDWQLIRPAPVLVQAGKTGDSVAISFGINGTRAETFWAAHVQLESGVNCVSPYIATSGGATATRTAGAIAAPVSVISGSQGWFAIRAAPEWDAAHAPGGGTGFRNFMQSDDGTNNNRIGLFYRESAANVSLVRQAGGVGTTSPGVAMTAAYATSVTVVGVWTPTSIGVSVNGSALSSTGDTNPPSGMTTVQVLSGSAAGWFDGTALWAAIGGGTLTSSDLAALAALPDVSPALFLPVAAGVTALLSTYNPIGRKFHRVRVGEPVVTVG